MTFFGFMVGLFVWAIWMWPARFGMWIAKVERSYRDALKDAE